MRLLTCVLALALAGCGASTPSPAKVARSWSAALNRGDDEAAAAFFAKDARVVQGGSVLRFRTRADAVRWNASLPCSGHITKLVADGSTVTVAFTLGQRPGHACDGPGAQAGAVFEVRNGKIVLWHQTDGGASLPPGQSV